MTRSQHRPRAARWRAGLLGIALLSAVGLFAGCGTQPAVEAGTGPDIAVDETLRARLPEPLRGRGVLRVVTDASYPPMSFFAEDGRTITGFEADLAAAVAARLGLRLEMSHAAFTEVLPGVSGGAYDVALSAVTDTPERERHADFVNYFVAGTSILVQRGNATGVTELRDLCGQPVAVEVGTVHVDLLRRTQPQCAEPIDVRTFPSNADALVELRRGRAVAVLTDYPVAVYSSTDSRQRAHFQLASTTQYEPGPYGIVVAKRQPELRDVLRDALDWLIRSGAYGDLLVRWDVEQGGLRQAEVNAGGGPVR